MKTKRGLFVMAFLSLTLPRGQDQARAQRPAGDDEEVIAPAYQAKEVVAPAYQAAKVILPYTRIDDLASSPEERGVATRIDQLRYPHSSADPQQRKVNESKLRDAVEEQFDLRQARLGRELEALRGEVSALESLVSESPARRAKAIARGVRRAVLEEDLPGEEMHLQAGQAQGSMGVAQGQRLTGVAQDERDVMLRIWRLGRQLGTAAQGERADIEKRLREALGEQFDLYQVRFARAVAALREEVQELDELVKKRREGRDEAIARRLRSLGVGRN